MNTIALSSIPYQVLNTVLDGQNCTIAIRWLQDSLYLDLKVGDIVICEGNICQNKIDIIQYRSNNFRGTLHFWDIRGDRKPSYDLLNVRYYLVFVRADEELPLKLRY